MLKIQLRNNNDFSGPSGKDVIILLCLVIVMMLFQAMADRLGQLLAMRSDVFTTLELWRIFSAHMIHANWQHLMINLASLIAALCLIPEVLHRKIFPAILMINAVIISLFLMASLEEHQSYYGFSALFYAFLTSSTIIQIKENPLAIWVLIFVILKTIWEQWFGPLASSINLVGGQVAVNTHFTGALTGAAVGVVWRVLSHRPKKRCNPPRNITILF